MSRRSLLPVYLVALAVVVLPSAAHANVVKDAFTAFSRAKGNARVFHQQGDAYRARIWFPLGSAMLGGRLKGQEGMADAIVRVSRGGGFKGSDVLGLAVRIGDVYTGKLLTRVSAPGDSTRPLTGAAEGRARDDLLLVTSHEGRFGRRLPRLSSGFFDGPFSSLLPFRGDGERQLVRAYPIGRLPADPALGDLGQVEEQARQGAARFELRLEGVRSRQSVRIGALVLTERLSASEADALKFQPWLNTSWSLRPVGFLNQSIRRPAYRGSESTR